MFGLVPVSPSVISEATAEEELGSLENVRRWLLIQRLEGSRWRLRRTRSAMGFESTLGWKLLYREELREEPAIDAHRYSADVAIHVHIIVTQPALIEPAILITGLFHSALRSFFSYWVSEVFSTAQGAIRK